MSENRYLRDYEVGESFVGYFVLRRKELRTARNGQPYLIFEFGDRSGRLSGNIWDDAIRMYDDFIEGTVLKVRGIIETYQGNKQVTIKQIRNVNPEDSVDPSDLLPSTDVDPLEYLNELQQIISEMNSEPLKQLLISFMDDETFTSMFLKAPGGKLWHHNRIGGLIEHTVGVCRVCVMLGQLYPEVNSDLLTAGAILHDVGKVEEFSYTTFIDYSDRGRLVGHITLGAQWVAQRSDQIEDFPPDLLDKIQHLVLSHQGEFGSPVQPATREAFLLHFADQIDSKMDALRRISKDLPEGERWTFVKLLGRHLDLGNSE